MNPKVGEIAVLVTNAWNWGLSEFLDHTGLVDSPETCNLFVKFQNAADALRAFDADVLRVLTTPQS